GTRDGEQQIARLPVEALEERPVTGVHAHRVSSVHSRGLAQPIDPNRLLAVVAEVAREARPHVDAYVALDSSLERDLGLDSLARVELVLRLEREFAASLPERALASSETPRDLLRFVLASAGRAPQSAG